MNKYIKELKAWGIDYGRTSESDKEIIKQYYKEGTPASVCAHHLVFPW